jgi:hypothetical protein
VTPRAALPGHEADPILRVHRSRLERMAFRNRRLRRLLVDVLWYLERPCGDHDCELELQRRARLAARIREQVAE